MKNLIKILILISVALLFCGLVNGQSLEDRFVESCRTTDADDVIFVDYTFRDFGFNYDDVDNAIGDSPYTEIYVYVGDKKIPLYLDVTKHKELPQYILPPNLREYFFSKLCTLPVDSVEVWRISYGNPNKNKLLQKIMPVDPKYFIEYFRNRFGDDLINSLTLHDIEYFIELSRPRYVGWEDEFYTIFPNAKK